MGRHLKRVSPSFSWPLKKTWGGYLNPYYAQAATCPDCKNGYDRAGGRPDANAALFYEQWYGTAPFDPIAYGAEPLSPLSPEIWRLARRNVRDAPAFYMSSDEARERRKFRQGAMNGFPHDEPLVQVPSYDRETAIAREAHSLYEVCFKDHWNHHLIQADVDALVAADRLWDFTRRPRTPEQEQQLLNQAARGGSHHWLEEPNGHHPTAAEVNARSLEGMGHDALNQGTCVEARCKREGVPHSCARCNGDAKIWPSPEIRQHYEDWRPEDPPTGDGYQLWENTSEGSPISPVFTSLEELCAWAEHGATTFGSFRATKAEWMEMLDGGVVHATQGNAIFL